jgi:hypothetical protein
MVGTTLEIPTEMEVDPTEVASEIRTQMETGSTTTISNRISTIIMVSDPDHRIEDSLTMGSEMALALVLEVPETLSTTTLTTNPEEIITMASTMGPGMALFPTPEDQVTPT